MTVEFVLWLPFIMAFLVIISDISMIMFNRTMAVRAIEDVNRQRAIGVLVSDQAVEDRITEILRRSDGSVIGQVDSHVVSAVVVTQIEMPVTSIDMFGIVARMGTDLSVVVRSQQIVEAMGV
ncbi:hypothetical protein HKCCE3408_08215 [Rhodobacterales bacterium HKCCE3408]|nr:hypothetical protein [Rhodobacterales bacterium HKCCE3408]